MDVADIGSLFKMAPGHTYQLTVTRLGRIERKNSSGRYEPIAESLYKAGPFEITMPVPPPKQKQ